METKYILKVNNGLDIEISGVTFFNIQSYLESDLIAYKETEIKEVKVNIEKGFKIEEICRILSLSCNDFETMIRKSTITFTD